MSVHFDTVLPAEFAGIKFPVDRVEVVGGLRDHIHEYPHQDGGSPELLGRRLYVIRMHAPFDETIKQYPGNYPEGLSALRGLFEKGTRAPLTIPTLGTITAYCRNWPQTWTAQVRSGEVAEFEFVEQPSDLEFTIRVNLDGLGDLMAELSDSLSDFYSPTDPIDRLFADIEEAVDTVLIARDQAELASLQMEQRILKLESLVSEADRTLKVLQNPNSWRVLEALKNLWASALDLAEDAHVTGLTIQTYVVPRMMTAADISRALYKEATRAVEILQLNDSVIEDAFAIPASTKIRYFADAS